MLVDWSLAWGGTFFRSASPRSNLTANFDSLGGGGAAFKNMSSSRYLFSQTPVPHLGVENSNSSGQHPPQCDAWRWQGRVRATGSVYNPCYNPWVQPVVKTVQPIQPVQGVVYLKNPYSMVVWVVQFLQRVVPRVVSRVVYRAHTLVELGG